MKPFYDLAVLQKLRKQYLGVDPEKPPSVIFLTKQTKNPTRIAILPSSFNPPTTAHLGLVELARKTLSAEEIVLSFGRVIVDKPLFGLTPEDRLCALMMIQESRPMYQIAVPSAGLYVDLAIAYQKAYPNAEKFFLVGFDKIEQIFDARYYEDKQKALQTLFSYASFAVAPREGKGKNELEELLKNPENRAFSNSITLLPLDPCLQTLSSTKIRKQIQQNIFDKNAIPKEIISMLQEIKSFRNETDITQNEAIEANVYRLRTQLIKVASISSRSVTGDIRPILQALLSEKCCLIREKLLSNTIDWNTLWHSLKTVY